MGFLLNFHQKTLKNNVRINIEIKLISMQFLLI